MYRLVKTARRMFADIRAQRIDLTIVVAFAVLVAVFADGCLLWLVSLVSVNTAMSLRECCPAVRRGGVGLLCAALFLAACLRPFWRTAWREAGSDA